MTRNGFIFYASFFDALSDVDDNTRLIVYDTVCKYALMGEDPSISGTALALFKLIKPQLDANNTRYENGKNGGRKNQTRTEVEPNTNQDGTEREPKRNRTRTKTEPNANQDGTEKEPKEKEKVKEKVKENEKEKVKEKENEKGHTSHSLSATNAEALAEKTEFAENVSMTNAEHQALIGRYGEAFAARCIEVLDNYKGANGKKYKSDYRAILNWVVDRVEKEQKENGKRAGIIGGGVEENRPATDWGLDTTRV